MDDDRIRKELDRLFEKLSKTEPESPEYAIILQRIDSINKTIIYNDKECDKILQQEQKIENETKRLDVEQAKIDLENRKMDFEEKKFAFQREDAEKKNQIERDRLEFQKEESKKRLDLDEREAEDKKRMTKGQAIGRLVEIFGGEALKFAGCILCIKYVGLRETTEILPKSQMAFIPKTHW